MGEAPSPGPLDFPADPASVVLVRAVADALDAWQVSTYGTPPITPVASASRKEVGRRPKFDAGTPTAADNDVCITIEPAARGEAARAVASGVAVCRLLVNDESHTRAVPIAGDKTQLETSDVGGYAILWKPDEDDANGERWGLVLLSSGNAGGNDPNACRSMLVGKGPDSALTGEIPAGVGKCANVGPETVYLAYDADVTPPNIGYWGGWVSTPFTTRAGETTATVFLNEEGEPAAVLTADAGSGTIVTRPMTYVGCDGRGRMRFKTFDCLWCGDVWAGPCGDNEFELLVSCGVAVCDPPVSLPARVGFWIDTTDITAGSASFPVTLEFLFRPTPPPGVTGWPDYAADGRAFWGADLNPYESPDDVVWAVLVEKAGPSGQCMTLEVWAKDGTKNEWGGVEPGLGLPAPVALQIPSPGDEAWITAAPVSDVDLCSDADADDGGVGSELCCSAEGQPLHRAEGANLPAASLSVPDGVGIGDYAANVGPTSWTFDVVTAEGTVNVAVACAAGVWKAYLGATVVVASSASCDPFGVVFPGAAFGATGDVTLELV
jgi:hypothetical protein